MALGTLVLGGLVANSATFDHDALRYVAQAQRIAEGDWRGGLVGSIDHPAYPLLIAGAHALLGGESPSDWQRAAQVAATGCAVLLALPLYGLATTLVSWRAAWLAVAMVYLVPGTSRLLADGLSESTFLLFWTGGLWSAVLYFQRGRIGWLLGSVGLSGLAYLARPEGLLLPAVLVVALIVTQAWPRTRAPWRSWALAMGLLVVGPTLVAAPLVVARGGAIATKPAIGRVLGTAPPSPAQAVERKRPQDEGQGTARALLDAGKSVALAARSLASLTVVALVPLGLLALVRSQKLGRSGVFLGLIAAASIVGLVRLHLTGGYCQPRHALVLVELMIVLAGTGWRFLSESARPGIGRLMPLGLVVGLGLAAWPSWSAPLHDDLRGYREAADWLAERENEATIDPPGMTLYYAGRPGVTFANMHESRIGNGPRWVVARRAHLEGPWPYCRRLRELVAGRAPVASFPARPQRGQSLVMVFDRSEPAPPVVAREVKDGSAGPERR